jgi:4-amino-4-deoxy-L-arabinose transferase-like glycosyltransferase
MKLRAVCTFLLGAAVLSLLVSFTISAFVIQETAVVVLHVSAVLPYLMACLFLICVWFALARDGTRRWLWGGLAILALSYFALSLRVIKLDMYGGHLWEEIAFVEIPIAQFRDVERYAPCYSASDFVFRLKAPRSSEVTLFRGVWPANLDKRRFEFLKPCATSSAESDR